MAALAALAVCHSASGKTVTGQDTENASFPSLVGAVASAGQAAFMDMTHDRRLAQSDRIHCECLLIDLCIYVIHVWFHHYFQLHVHPHLSTFLSIHLPHTNRQAKHQLRDRLIQGQIASGAVRRHTDKH